MRKYLALILLLFVSAVSYAQHPYLDSIKKIRPRVATNMGFLLLPNIGGDNWDRGVNQGYAPLNHPFDPSYRWHDFAQIDSLGMSTFMAIEHPLKQFVGDTLGWESSSPDTFIRSPREPRSRYAMIKSEAVLNSLYNSKYLRFECERHSPPTDSVDTTRVYPGFLTESGLTGLDASDSLRQGTVPPWLSTSPMYADTTHSIVQLKKGRDVAGIFDHSFWHKGFLHSTNYSPYYYWSSDPNWTRKLLLRLRVRIDSTLSGSSSDTVLRIQMIEGAVTILDTGLLVSTSTFPHAGSNFDLIGLPCWATPATDSASMIVEFRLSWAGKVSLSADYLEVMTDSLTRNEYLAIPDTVITFPDTIFKNRDRIVKLAPEWDQGMNAVEFGGGKFAGYAGLIANMPVFVDRTMKPFDSVAQLVNLGGEYPIPFTYPIKAFEKQLHDRTDGRMTSYVYLVDSGISWLYKSGYPDGWKLLVEGVHLGWLDSSIFADPQFFGAEGYIWLNDDGNSNHTTMPSRTRQQDSASIQHWIDRYVPSHPPNTWGNITPHGQPYSRNAVDSTGDFALGRLLKSFRPLGRAFRETQKPGFRQRFIYTIQAGGVPTIVWDSAVTGKQYALYNATCYRPPTGAELKAMCHVGVAVGASGIETYSSIFTDTVKGGKVPHNAGPDGGLLGPHGERTAYVKIDSLADNVASTVWRCNAGGTSDSLWVGWDERFDTAMRLFPLVALYGDTLLKSNWLADYRAFELHPDASLPFYDTIHAVDDSGHQDLFTKNYATNRTYVYTSVWFDTLSQDTLIYIVNTRTDDSWDTSGHCQTFDRRYVTMKMKAAHLVTDVADTLELRTMGKVRTPYVGEGDSLVVWLLPGDGVLVRLSPAPDSMKQMRIALDYPKIAPSTTSDKYDHGKAKFSEYVVGVTKVNGYDSLTIPSSLYSYVGIKDWQSPKVHQDSLIYQSFSSDRPEKWRHQNWTAQTQTGPVLKFKYKNNLASVPTNGRRDALTGLDSVAHPVIIKTDIEGTSDSYGGVGFYDPFFVDSLPTSYRNFNTTSDTLLKKTPFLPQDPIAGYQPGAHPQHYGGVFLGQNPHSEAGIPNYALKAYGTHLWPWPGHWLDTIADQWANPTFLEWHKGDVNNPDTVIYDPSFPVIFKHDSEKYTAVYKEHNLVFTSPYTADLGYSYNNQRKLVFLGRDDSNRAWYRNVFASLGRIYTAKGWHQGPAGPLNGWMHWEPEQLVTEWKDSTACYPSIVMHVDTFNHDTTFSYFYQQKDPWGNRRIYRTTIVNNVRIKDSVSDELLGTESTPSAAGIDLYERYSGDTLGQWDIVAYPTAGDGIALRTMHCHESGLTQTVSDPIYVGTENANWPTLWASDSAWITGKDDGDWNRPVYLAWQDTTDGITRNPPGLFGPSVLDIYARKFIMQKHTVHNGLYALHVDASDSGANVSRAVDSFSFDNRRPCISGIRDDDTLSLFIAYESRHSVLDPLNQGISVARSRPPASPGWSQSNWHTTGADDYTTDTVMFLKPSITATAYTISGGIWTPTKYYYSLAFEAASTTGSCNVWNQAWDNSTQRVTRQWISGIRSPQLAVAVQAHDSDIERMAIGDGEWPDLPFGTQACRWLIHQNVGLFKANVNHNEVYDYMQTDQLDSASQLHVIQGVGEFLLDDGDNFSWLDLSPTEDYDELDTTHSSSYFLATDQFWLPAHSTITYSPWVTTNSDSLFRNSHETLNFRLAFYDSTNSYVFTADSMFICDTQPRVKLLARTIDLSYPSSGSGRFRLERMNGRIAAAGQVQEIISMKRLSAQKRSSGHYAKTDGLDFTVLENPVKSHCDIDFNIPMTGHVTFEVYDALGKQVDRIAEDRQYRNGEHTVRWIPPSALPSGIYTIAMRYGNDIKTARVSYAK